MNYKYKSTSQYKKIIFVCVSSIIGASSSINYITLRVSSIGEK